MIDLTLQHAFSLWCDLIRRFLNKFCCVFHYGTLLYHCIYVVFKLIEEVVEEFIRQRERIVLIFLNLAFYTLSTTIFINCCLRHLVLRYILIQLLLALVLRLWWWCVDDKGRQDCESHYFLEECTSQTLTVCLILITGTWGSETWLFLQDWRQRFILHVFIKKL